MASGGASSTQSSQQSKQNTGVTQRFKDPLSQKLSDIINPVSRRIGEVALGSPFRLGTQGDPSISGFNFGKNLSKFSKRGKFGLDPTFDTAISTLGRNLFNKSSSSAATRGQLSPENLSNVVGSALTQAAPALAGFADKSRNRELFGPAQLAKNIQGIRTGQNAAQLQEESIRQKRLAQSLSSVGAITQALGGFGTSFGSSSGSSDQAGICWIAEVLYGPLSVEVFVVRWYLTTYHNDSWFVALYRKYGQWASKQPWLVRMLKPLFDMLVRRGCAKLSPLVA